jgi:hypothetical protein
VGWALAGDCAGVSHSGVGGVTFSEVERENGRTGEYVTWGFIILWIVAFIDGFHAGDALIYIDRTSSAIVEFIFIIMWVVDDSCLDDISCIEWLISISAFFGWRKSCLKEWKSGRAVHFGFSSTPPALHQTVNL